MTVVVDGVSKRFEIPHQEPMWALADIDLRFAPGTATAVIGANGAGKTTLLKLIEGVHAPTTGVIRRPAACAALIDLAMGFHADMTGWENLRLGAAMAGLERRAASRAVEAMAETTGLGRHLDVPYKRLSTGMAARLGCAVAVHSRPDVLLLDEALAVGDASFQEAMLRAARELVADGTTMILVTHSPALAREATDDAVWIDRGRVAAVGPTAEVLGAHAVATATPTSDDTSVRLSQLRVAPERIATGDALRATAAVSVARPVTGVAFQVDLYVPEGAEPWMRSSGGDPLVRRLNVVASTGPLLPTVLTAGHQEVTIDIASLPITDAHLELTLMALDEQGRIIDEVSKEVQVGVSPSRPCYAMSVVRLGRT